MEIDRNAPATKGDLSGLEIRLNESYDILHAQLRHMRDDLKEAMRDFQAELVKAFYSFGQAEGNESALRSRVATLEDRVMEIEKRLNIPPIH